MDKQSEQVAGTTPCIRGCEDKRALAIRCTFFPTREISSLCEISKMRAREERNGAMSNLPLILLVEDHELIQSVVAKGLTEASSRLQL
jgi:hypothetical protein